MPFWLRITIVAAVAVAVGCIPDSSKPPEQQDELSAFETEFTDPNPGEADEVIASRIIELLEQTPSGATVRAAFYTFSLEELADAFVDAVERGVDVEVVLGNTNTFSDGTPWSAVELLQDGLGDRLTICNEEEDDGGCMGERRQHNKFITFSRLDDGSEDVIVQTSANLTNDGLEEFNNFVLIRDDAALHEAFVSYFDDLRRDETDLDYNRDEQGDTSTRVHFFPRAEGDPVVEALERVDCQKGAELHLAMAFFTDYRSDVATELRQLDGTGCDVHVLTREAEGANSPGSNVVAALSGGDVELGMFSENNQPQLHSKYLILKGAYDDHDDARVVFTGSHNYTRNGLRENDEVLLKIRDDDVYQAHREDWHRLRDHAETLHP